MDILIFCAAYPAYLLGKFFVSRDRGFPEPKKALERAVWLGLLSLFLAIVLSTAAGIVFFGDQLQDIDALLRPLSLIETILYAAIEEIVKFLPLALIIYKKTYFNEITDGIIYFSIAGLTFGAAETFLYSLGEGGIVTIFFRYGIGMFLHGSLTAIAGYYLVRHKLDRTPKSHIAYSLLAVIVMHVVYNIGAFGILTNPYLIILTGGMALLSLYWMLILFYRASQEDYHQGRWFKAPSLRPVSNPPAASSQNEVTAWSTTPQPQAPVPPQNQPAQPSQQSTQPQAPAPQPASRQPNQPAPQNSGQPNPPQSA